MKNSALQFWNLIGLVLALIPLTSQAEDTVDFKKQIARHLSFAKNQVKYANLHLSLLHAMGLEQENFADSTGRIPELFSAS